MLQQLSRSSFLVLVLSSAQATRPAGSHQTHLLTGHGVPLDGRGVTNVLVVTTSVRVLHGVHRHTSHLGPGVALGLKEKEEGLLPRRRKRGRAKRFLYILHERREAVKTHLVLVERSSSLEHRLVVASSSSGNSHHGAAVRADDLLGARGQADASHASVCVVGDDGGVVSRRAGKFAAISRASLRVAHDGSFKGEQNMPCCVCAGFFLLCFEKKLTFRHLSEGQHVSDLQGSLGSAVHELSRKHSFGSHEVLSHGLKPAKKKRKYFKRTRIATKKREKRHL